MLKWLLGSLSGYSNIMKTAEQITVANIVISNNLCFMIPLSNILNLFSCEKIIKLLPTTSFSLIEG